MKPRITVFTPIYNEEKTLPYMLDSLLKQSIKPSNIIVGDNNSQDKSIEIVYRFLEKTNIDYSIISVKRKPNLGKWNISNVYWHLNQMLQKKNYDTEYVSIIESDVVLEPKYFEKLISRFNKDPKLCITAGSLEPLGLIQDPFPLTNAKIMLWGSNRVYRASQWFELNRVSDLRKMPSWDTDHVILTLLEGYYVYPIPYAKSWTFRGVNEYRGFIKVITDASHGLPFWWVLYKTVQKKDIDYLVGYLKAPIKFKKNNILLNELVQIYHYSACKTLIRKIIVA
jgi:glycosyltransferase involved in cell wall biosynthesis